LTKHDLKWLLGALPVARFLRDHYERAIWYGSSPVETSLDFSRASFEALLWMDDHPSMVKLVSDGEPDISGERTGEAHRAWVLQRYQEGCTIVFHGVERRSPRVAELQRNLEGDLGGMVSVNAYLTPPSARGLSIHYDLQDTFIVQVEGTKLWHLFETRGAAPLRNWPDAVDPTKLHRMREVLLRPGQRLYVPRGTAHRAESREDASLHLTIGLQPHLWTHVLNDLVEPWERRDVRLRTSVPTTRAARAQDPTLIDVLSALLAECRDATTVDRAYQRVVERTMLDLRPPPEGSLVDPESMRSLRVDHLVEKRAGMPCVTRRLGAGARLAFPGLGNGRSGPSAINGPVSLAPAFRFIARTQVPFPVSSLPGRLTDAAKLTLVRELIAHGLLRRCRTAREDPGRETNPQRITAARARKPGKKSFSHC